MYNTHIIHHKICQNSKIVLISLAFGACFENDPLDSHIKIFGTRHLESLGYHACGVDWVLIMCCFGTMTACDGRADRRTDDDSI